MLPAYMIPAAFVTLEAMPLTPNGKLNRRALSAVEWARVGPETEELVLPQNEAERAIAEVWRACLGLETVGVHANFFDLGGHSLLLGRVRTALAERLGRSLSMTTLFQYPTIHALAEHLAQNGDAGPITVEQGRAALRSAGRAALHQARQQRQQHRSRQDSR
jgi:hypothetical protein